MQESCVRYCIDGVSEDDVDSIDSFPLSVGFMYDEMRFLHVDVYTSTLPATTLPWFKHVYLFHDPFQPFVDDVIEPLVPTVEHHYQSLIGRFVAPPL